jgi:uncharacterized protein
MKKFIIAILFVIHLSAFSQRPLPELWGLHVHDEAHVLTQQTIDNLESQLVAYEDSTSNQLAILIIPSLDGEVLEEYALHVAEKWKLGQKDKDNGALLLIAVNDHKMRIEVGQGLEGVLTDALSSSIIRNEIAPSFRQNNYDEGVIKGVNAMISAIGGEYTADDSDTAESIDELNWKERILIGVFIFSILGIFTFLALFTQGGIAWGLYAFLIPFYATFPMVILGVTGGLVALLTYVISFPILRFIVPKTRFGKQITQKMNKSSGSGGWGSGGGWSSGGGSGWSSGSSSGSSFSGGGGSVGGGGSSGSW